MNYCEHPTTAQLSGPKHHPWQAVGGHGEYINTFVGNRQGLLSRNFKIRSLFFFLFLLLSLFPGLQSCTSSTPPQPGDDVFVGRPASSPQSNAPARQTGALWYRIEPQEDSIHLQIRLLNPPGTTTFFLPGDWAGHTDFDVQIVLGSVVGPEGPLPVTLDRRAGRIDILTGGEDWVELSYRVQVKNAANTSSSLHPWSNDDAFFAYAPTALILPSAGLAEQLVDIPVELHLPSQWTPATTWPLKYLREEPSRTVAGYLVDDVRSLRDAFFGAGQDWRSLRREKFQGDVEIVFAGTSALDEEALTEAAGKIFDYYQEHLGIYDRLTGVVLPRPLSAGSSLRGMGRRGGFILEVPEDRTLDEDVLTLLAHEAFHCWNGHVIVPDPEQESQVEWFKEGLTHYVALKTLRRLELISDRVLRRELARSGQYYLQNPIIAGGPTRPVDYLRLPYDLGLLRGLALDTALFHHSGGNLEIEDWFSLLLSPEFKKESRRMTPELLRRSFLHLSAGLSQSVGNTYSRLITSETALDVDAIFSGLGLHFLGSDGYDPARVLPLGDAELFRLLFTSLDE